MPVTEFFKTLATLLENGWKLTLAVAIGTGILLYAPGSPLVPFVKEARAAHGALLAIAFWICASHFVVFVAVTVSGGVVKAARPQFTEWRERRMLSGLSGTEKDVLSMVLKHADTKILSRPKVAPELRGLLRQGILNQDGGEFTARGDRYVQYEVAYWARERLRKNPDLLDPALG